jgi:hypothetical protein
MIRQPILVEPDHSVTPAPLCEKVVPSTLGVLVQGASNYGRAAQIDSTKMGFSKDLSHTAAQMGQASSTRPILLGAARVGRSFAELQPKHAVEVRKIVEAHHCSDIANAQLARERIAQQLTRAFQPQLAHIA